MSVSGSYVLDKNENYDKILSVIGVSAERTQKLLAAKPQLDVELISDTLKVVTKSGDLVFNNSVTLGQPGKIQIAGLEYELNVTFTGSKGKGSFVVASKKGDIAIEVSDAGFVETLVLEGVTAKRHFKRL